VVGGGGVEGGGGGDVGVRVRVVGEDAVGGAKVVVEVGVLAVRGVRWGR